MVLNRKNTLFLSCLFFLQFLPAALWGQDIDSTETENTQPLIFIKLDSEPAFPGGNRGLSDYWQKNFQHKRTRAKGEGKVEFIINEDGTISNITIAKPLDSIMDNAAKRAIAKMPRWKPAIYKGKPIAQPYSITYWEQYVSFWTGQPEVYELPAPESIRHYGWSFRLWIGIATQTNDFAEYMNSFRGGLGLGVGFHYKKFNLALEYDILFPSIVKKEILFDNQLFSADAEVKMSGINGYLPIGYTVFENEKWRLSPFVAPTVNALNLDSKKSDSYGEAAVWSYTLGLDVDKTIQRSSSFLGRSSKQSVIKSCWHGRFFINLINFFKPNFTNMSGVAVGFNIGGTGFFYREK